MYVDFLLEHINFPIVHKDFLFLYINALVEHIVFAIVHITF